MKKVIAFDLDGTLAASKSPITERMAAALNRLLEHMDVCIISGGKFEQFEKQVTSQIHATPARLARLHMMPTCGTRYMQYNAETRQWDKVYSEDLTTEEKAKIAAALDKGVNDLGHREEKVYGERIEDRGSQMAYSIYGQDIVDVLGPEGVRIKEAWDPDNSKKKALRDYIEELIPEFEVRAGGVTTIDVTKKGIDKAYGMKKLCEELSITKEDILFIGDRLQEGGNDYPVKAAGIDTIEVRDWMETAAIIEAINAVL